MAGEADLAAAGQLARVLDDCVTRDPTCLTIDATALTFADSSALKEMVRAARIVREHGGDVYLRRPCRVLTLVLKITGAIGMFIVLDEDEAEASPLSHPLLLMSPLHQAHGPQLVGQVHRLGQGS